MHLFVVSAFFLAFSKATDLKAKTLEPKTTTTTTTASSATTTTTASSATTTTTASSAPSVGSNGCAIDFEKFKLAVAASSASGQGTPPAPNQSIYDAYVKHVCGNISVEEQAQFLTNALMETAGLTVRKERMGEGKFNGRGFIPLWGEADYQAASKALYQDDRLIQNPDLVSKDDEVGWQTALWQWRKLAAPWIKKYDALKKNDLGWSVKAISSIYWNLCASGPSERAKMRLAVYNQIRKVWGLAGEGNLGGCKPGPLA